MVLTDGACHDIQTTYWKCMWNTLITMYGLDLNETFYFQISLFSKLFHLAVKPYINFQPNRYLMPWCLWAELQSLFFHSQSGLGRSGQLKVQWGGVERGRGGRRGDDGGDGGRGEGRGSSDQPAISVGSVASLEPSQTVLNCSGTGNSFCESPSTQTHVRLQWRETPQ